VQELLDAGPERLAELGLHGVARRRLLAGSELARRFQPAVVPPPIVRHPRDVLPRLAPLRRSPTEVLALLALDIRLSPVDELIRVAEGGGAHIAVEPRDVFAPALQRRAAAIVIAHNHPSGVAEPSAEDAEFTDLISRAGRLLGIEVLDHLVVTARSYFSFRQAGMLR
jgi:DNA repair protein RadC